MSGRTLHYTTPGFRPQLVDIAPDAEDPASKRYHTIEEEDKNLNKNLGQLEEGTRARNREFLKRLDEVWIQTSGWQAKLITEKKEAEETIMQIRVDYEKHFKEFQDSFLTDVRNTYKRIDHEMIPPQIDRVAEEEEQLDKFINVTVPTTVENQSGEVSRQLKKQYETFDIEKQKGSKKEMKFITKANQHIQHSAQKFTDEAALLNACFFNLEEDIVYTERRSARMHLRRYDNAVKAVVDLQNKIKEVTSLRAEEDAELLDTLIETQSLLQTTILEHFGAVKDTERPPPNFEKLDRRVAKREAHSKASSRNKPSAS